MVACELESCSEKANYGVPGGFVRRCKPHKIDKIMRTLPGRVCKNDECDKMPVSRFEFCKKHGGGNRCQRDGCEKIARGSTNYCSAHGGGNRCQRDGCGNGAISPTNYCRAHGGGNRCQATGCGNGALSPTNYCSAHGGGKRCQRDGCGKSAVSPTNFCVGHGGGNRCQRDGCGESAQGSTKFCIKHGGGDRCQRDGCKDAAFGSTDFCYKHGGKIEVLCKGLIPTIDCPDYQPCPFEHRGNRKYKKYCTSCFQRNFPLDPLTFQIRSKTKELAVRDFINANFTGFMHDKPLWIQGCDCSLRRRIDHRCLINNTMVCIETDENQHRSYDPVDEEQRYHDTFMGFSGKWIYIRFNPDKFVKNGVKKNPTIATRLNTLKEEIVKQIKRAESYENKDILEIVKLFYDE